ncbi:winged helix-turn-helix transcriptional regulator [Archaeoglobus veneficus]|uniref:HTH hxlR-type domain-containing protein n=1 Tax=Archaeoglobus veneficus (strain DSM 11195 / SNP6) TaxID=693661 RepID=F2KRE9_ARCVS|nr:winged helix-turn-helix transcriptional regulator [Archaeoglobus veneficus]AEA47883.1 hypothetical protein Arcve_1890 [Archaeoglobus veneficus SNP6]
MKEPTDYLVRKISKKPNLTILLALKSGSKKWSDLEKLLNKKYVYQGLKELLNLGLIEVVITHDTPTGSKAYQLTPLGKKIVQHIEEIEKEFGEYHSQTPPKDPEKFIGEVIGGEGLD